MMEHATRNNLSLFPPPSILYFCMIGYLRRVSYLSLSLFLPLLVVVCCRPGCVTCFSNFFPSTIRAPASDRNQSHSSHVSDDSPPPPLTDPVPPPPPPEPRPPFSRPGIRNPRPPAGGPPLLFGFGGGVGRRLLPFASAVRS